MRGGVMAVPKKWLGMMFVCMWMGKSDWHLIYYRVERKSEDKAR
jgi:hypothetical protein